MDHVGLSQQRAMSKVSGQSKLANLSNYQNKSLLIVIKLTKVRSVFHFLFNYEIENVVDRQDVSIGE